MARERAEQSLYLICVHSTAIGKILSTNELSGLSATNLMGLFILYEKYVNQQSEWKPFLDILAIFFRFVSFCFFVAINLCDHLLVVIMFSIMFLCLQNDCNWSLTTPLMHILFLKLSTPQSTGVRSSYNCYKCQYLDVCTSDEREGSRQKKREGGSSEPKKGWRVIFKNELLQSLLHVRLKYSGINMRKLYCQLFMYVYPRSLSLSLLLCSPLLSSLISSLSPHSSLSLSLLTPLLSPLTFVLLLLLPESS